jgi:hypothetical protein
MRSGQDGDPSLQMRYIISSYSTTKPVACSAVVARRQQRSAREMHVARTKILCFEEATVPRSRFPNSGVKS